MGTNGAHSPWATASFNIAKQLAICFGVLDPLVTLDPPMPDPLPPRPGSREAIELLTAGAADPLPDALPIPDRVVDPLPDALRITNEVTDPLPDALPITNEFADPLPDALHNNTEGRLVDPLIDVLQLVDPLPLALHNNTEDNLADPLPDALLVADGVADPLPDSLHNNLPGCPVDPLPDALQLVDPLHDALHNYADDVLVDVVPLHDALPDYYDPEKLENYTLYQIAWWDESHRKSCLKRIQGTNGCEYITRVKRDNNGNPSLTGVESTA